MPTALDNKPRPYDLSQPAERIRLLREMRGYFWACRKEHHGTDREGRNFAMDALESWLKEIDAEAGSRVATLLSPPTKGSKE